MLVCRRQILQKFIFKLAIWNSACHFHPILAACFHDLSSLVTASLPECPSRPILTIARLTFTLLLPFFLALTGLSHHSLALPFFFFKWKSGAICLILLWLSFFKLSALVASLLGVAGENPTVVLVRNVGFLALAAASGELSRLFFFF